MPEDKRISALRLGGCMSEQGRLFAKEGERMRWGGGFEFGCSPVPYFAMLGELGLLSEALDLGACPFARDLEGDGAMDAAMRLMNSSSPEDRERGASILAMCWRVGAPLLDMKSKSYLGDKETSEIRFDIALACLSRGARMREACAEQGLEVDPEWLTRFAPSHPMLACEAVMWGCAKTLDLLIKAGLPLGPVEVETDSPRESLWTWLEDDNRDAHGVAAVLLAAGLDPREPGEDGAAPLDQMRGNGYAIKVALHVGALVRSIEEHGELQGAVGQAPARKPKAAL